MLKITGSYQRNIICTDRTNGAKRHPACGRTKTKEPRQKTKDTNSCNSYLIREISTMKSFLNDIQKHIPSDRIYTDDMQLLAWGTDAGFYRLLPQVVIQSANEKEIIEILKAAD